MEWLDTDVGSMKPALQKAPEVFESVGMNRAVHVGHGMIDDLVRVFPFQSVIGFQFIAVERRASFHMLFHFALQSLFLPPLDYHGTDLSAPFQDSHNGKDRKSTRLNSSHTVNS